MSQSATTSIIALNMKRGGGGVRTIHYSTINQFLGWEGGPDHTLQYYYQSLGWEGGPDHKLQYYYIPILGMGGGSRP